MKFRVISDVHAEFFSLGELGLQLPVMPEEHDTVLLIAGDLGVAGKPASYVPFATEMSKRFKYVAHIAGNHEFYGGSFVTVRDTINQEYRDAGISDNVGMFEREILEFDDVRVIMATLWTDFDGGDPISIMEAANFMNDYRMIRTGQAAEPLKFQLTPQDTYENFKISRDFIFEEVANAKADGKRVVVMTHHAPSRLSISPQYANAPSNGAFVSDLSNEILDADCDMVWIHGHVHQNQSYILGKCEVICNPHGYGNENPYFNPELVFEI